MPIYEYVCQSCQHRFEVKQRFSDAPVSTCVRCGEAVTKVISAPAIMFKGSGWYVTDYSDKFKAPAQPEATQKPVNGSGDQKASPSSGNETAATIPQTSGTSDSAGASQDKTGSSSSAPASSNLSTSSSSGTERRRASLSE
ncbi:MAG: FmdB family zinc ribbon protein [Nitrospiraceae bacterium]